MAKRKRRGRHLAQPEGILGPALRPIAWSALLGAAAAAALATPAYADPTGTASIPDAGSRPVPVGTVPLPTVGSFTAPIGNSPIAALAAEITAGETELSTLGEQLKQLGIERSDLRNALAVADYQWRQAGDLLRAAEDRADDAANKAFRDAAGLPPGLSGLHGLGELPGVTDSSSAASEAAARDVARARAAERTAYQAYLDAVDAEKSASDRYAALEATYKQREAALLELKRRHASEMAAVEREVEASEQRVGAAFVGGTAAGMQADARARAAVNFALSQLGKPYLWGAEGPDRYDCSGLMWAAYRSTGYTLPRVAKGQYYGTRAKTVSRYALLPGDLLFFSSSGDWTGIHHVGMYIGNGKMVHAPTTGDVVKVSTVWWSRFFAATRVYGAVPASNVGNTQPTVPETTGPAASPSSTSGSPSPSSTSGSPSPSSTSGSPSPSSTTTSPSPSSTTTSPSPTSTTTSPSPTSTTSSPSPTSTTSSPSPTSTTTSPSPDATSASPTEETSSASTDASTTPASEPTDTSAATPSADSTTASGS
jgi:cell wall-associated NlpC family hydrolase